MNTINSLNLNYNKQTSSQKKDEILDLIKRSDFKEKFNKFDKINKNSSKTKDENMTNIDIINKTKEQNNLQLKLADEPKNKPIDNDNTLAPNKKDEDSLIKNETVNENVVKNINEFTNDESIIKDKSNTEVEDAEKILEAMLNLIQNLKLKPEMFKDVENCEDNKAKLQNLVVEIKNQIESNKIDIKGFEKLLSDIKTANFLPNEIKNDFENKLNELLSKEIKIESKIENVKAEKNNDTFNKTSLSEKINSNHNSKDNKIDQNNISISKEIENSESSGKDLKNIKANAIINNDGLEKLEKELLKNSENKYDENKNIEIENINFDRITQKIKGAALSAKNIKTINPKELIDQIASKSKLTINKNNTVMEIKLEPESLGKLTLKVVLESGLLTAKFETENEKIKEILEKNIEELKSNLNAQGLNVQSLSVSVDSQGDFDRHKNLLNAIAYNKSMNKNSQFEIVEEIGGDNPYLDNEDTINQLA